MKAIVRKSGSPDYGYVIAECHAPECRDLNGRPWQLMHSRRLAEGTRLAERDAADHNRVHHKEDPRTLCPKCGQLTVKYTQGAWGDNWDCQSPECGYHHYYSLGD
jgi:hypothetical protein